MKNHIRDVTKKEPTTNISDNLIQARQIQAHIRDQFTDGQLPEYSRLSWVEIFPGAVRVRVTRWIE